MITCHPRRLLSGSSYDSGSCETLYLVIARVKCTARGYKMSFWYGAVTPRGLWHERLQQDLCCSSFGTYFNVRAPNHESHSGSLYGVNAFRGSTSWFLYMWVLTDIKISVNTLYQLSILYVYVWIYAVLSQFLQVLSVYNQQRADYINESFWVWIYLNCTVPFCAHGALDKHVCGILPLVQDVIWIRYCPYDLRL